MQALELNITPGLWLLTRMSMSIRGAAACWGKHSPLQLRHVDPPALPGQDWVLCRTRLGGICGTDLSIVMLRQRPDSLLQGFSSMPMILGHENVADVVEVGPGVEPSWKGKRVCVEPTLSCAVRGIDPPCPRCAAGEFGACENFGAAGQGHSQLPAGTSIGYNSRTGGSWGEYFVAHASQLVEVPDGMTDEQAILTDPLACSLHAVLRTNLSRANRVAVLGGGILGLGVVNSLRAIGYDGPIDVFARYGFQGKLAEARGGSRIMPAEQATDLDTLAAHLGSYVVRTRFRNAILLGGYDAVFDCVGQLDACLRIAAGRGQVCTVATASGHGTDLTPVWFRELSLIGAYGRQMETWDGQRISTYALTHQLMLAGKLRTDGLLTHEFPLTDYRHALHTATHKSSTSCVKAAFRFE